MKEQDVINEFIKREDLSPTEQKIKSRLFDLDGRIAKGREELEKLREELQAATDKYNAKQAELLSMSQKLEGMLQLAYDIQVEASTVKGDTEES